MSKSKRNCLVADFLLVSQTVSDKEAGVVTFSAWMDDDDDQPVTICALPITGLPKLIRRLRTFVLDAAVAAAGVKTEGPAGEEIAEPPNFRALHAEGKLRPPEDLPAYLRANNHREMVVDVVALDADGSNLTDDQKEVNADAAAGAAMKQLGLSGADYRYDPCGDYTDDQGLRH